MASRAECACALHVAAGLGSTVHLGCILARSICAGGVSLHSCCGEEGEGFCSMGGKRAKQVPADPHMEDLVSDDELGSGSGASASSGSASKSQRRKGKRGADADDCRKRSRGRSRTQRKQGKRGGSEASASLNDEADEANASASAEPPVKREPGSGNEGRPRKAASKPASASVRNRRERKQEVVAAKPNEEVERRTQNHILRRVCCSVNMACRSRHAASESF